MAAVKRKRALIAAGLGALILIPLLLYLRAAGHPAHGVPYWDEHPEYWESSRTTEIERRMQRVIIWEVAFEERPLRACLDEVFSVLEEPGDLPSIRRRYRIEPPLLEGEDGPRISLHLQRVPAIEALRYVTQLAGYRVSFAEEGTAVITSQPSPRQALLTAKFYFPPGAFSFPADSPADDRSAQNMRDFFADVGVNFEDPAATAVYYPDRECLLVTGQRDDLDLIDAYFSSGHFHRPPKVQDRLLYWFQDLFSGPPLAPTPVSGSPPIAPLKPVDPFAPTPVSAGPQPDATPEVSPAIPLLDTPSPPAKGVDPFR